LRAWVLSICLSLSATATALDDAISQQRLQDLLEDRPNRRLGGVYIGKVRPVYVDRDLYLQPIDAAVRHRPGCASREVLRLDDAPGSTAFRNKFEVVLRSWIANREVILVGKGTCSLQGEEFIFAVIPK
jgi:hypothetical protein